MKTIITLLNTFRLRYFTVVLISFCGQLLFAQTPPDGLVGEDLRDWIKENFYDSKHSSLGYTNARKQMYSTIDVQDDGDVYCVYTSFHQASANVSFLDPINAEHSIPQSWFDQSSIPRSDIHHLFPTHKDVNSARSNYPFDDITDSQTDKWYIVNSSNSGLSILTSIPSSNIDSYSELLNSTEFEPREDHKGDLARAAFYFYTMYPGVANQGNSSSGQGIISDLADPEILYQWHLDDPVDAWEQQRNNRVETAQGNRNPYIDNPDWVADAFGFESQDSNITITADLNDFGSIEHGNTSSSQNYTISGTDLTADVIVTAPTYFELSKDNTNFFSELTYDFADVNTNPQTIYIRFSPTSGSNGSITGSVLHASEGTSSVSLSVSGTESGNAITITDIIDIKNAIDENGEPTTTTEVNIQGIFYGINTNPGGFDFQFSLIDETAGINIRYDNGSVDFGTFSEGDEVIITGTVNHYNGLMQIEPSEVSLQSTGNSRKSAYAVSELNEDTESDLVQLSNVTIPDSGEWTGTSGNSTSFNVTIEVGGTSYTLRVDGDTELAEMTYAEVFGSNINNLNIVGLGGQFDSSSPYDDGYQILPYLASDLTVGDGANLSTSVSSLSDFGTIANGNHSDAQTYTISGSGLTNNVTVSAPSYFQISKDGSNYSSELTFDFEDVNNNDQTIYARFSPSSGSDGSISGVISHESSGVATVNVNVSGTESGNSSSSSIFSQDFEDAASDNWTYGADPEPYNISSDLWDIVESLNSITPQSGSKFWGMRDLENDNGGGAFEHTLTFDDVDISGYTGVQLKFNYYSIGFDDTDYLQYEVFEDNNSLGKEDLLKDTESTWNEINVNITDGTNQVKLVLIGFQNGSSDYAAFDNIQITGTSNTNPTLSASVSELNDFGEVENGANSNSQSYTLSGSDLSEDISITASSGFEISADNNNFTSSLTINHGDLNNADQTIYARFSPNSGNNGAITGTLSHSSSEVNTIEISVSGTETGNNNAPTNIELTATSINENQSSGTVVGIFSTTDEDSEDTHTYTLVNGDGDTDNASFFIDEDSLKSNEIFNFENQDTYSIRIATNDNNGGVFEKTFNISINNINDTPVLNLELIDQEIQENQTLSYQFDENSFTDEDAEDVLTYTATLSDDTTLPEWLDFNSSNRTFSGTPTSDDLGILNIKVTADDGNSGMVDDQFQLEVLNANDIPEFTSEPVTGVVQDVNYNYVIAASDQDVDATLTLSAPDIPNWLNFTDHGNGTATLSGTPTNDDVGEHDITILLTDGIISEPVTQNFIITVVNTNEAPEFNSNPIITALEDQTYNYEITATDSDANASLSFSSSNLPDWLTLTDNGNGTALLTGIPLDEHVGDQAIQLSLTDGFIENPITQSFTITVINVNDAPSFTLGEDPIVNEDAGEQFFGLWAHSFEDNDQSEFQNMSFSVSNDNNSLFTEQPWVDGQTGDLRFTSAPNLHGVATVTLILNDGGGTENGGAETSAPQTFTITVNAVNDAPSFQMGENQIIDEDAGSQTVLSWSTNMNDNDEEEVQSLSFSLSNDNNSLFSVQPTIDESTGNLSYTPAENTHGIATVSVVLSDDGGTANGGIDASEVQSFTITINPINDAPVFTSNAINQIDEDLEYNYDITIFDPDENDNLTISAPSIPEWLLLNDHGNGTASLSGRPKNEDVGEYNITLEVSDGIASPVQQSYLLTVININDAPVFDDIQDVSLCPGENSGIIDLLNLTTDVDLNETLTFSMSTNPPLGVNISLNESELFIEHNATTASSFEVNLKVTDSSNAEDITTIIVTISYLEAEITINGSELVAPQGNAYKWFLNGIVIPNKTSRTLSNLEVGSYHVEVTYGNGCTDTSEPIEIDAKTSLTPNDISDKISLFPNPATDFIYFDFENAIFNKNVKMQLINIHGQLIYSNERFEEKLNISDLPNGIYIIRIMNDHFRAVKRFIKK